MSIERTEYGQLVQGLAASLRARSGESRRDHAERVRQAARRVLIGNEEATRKVIRWTASLNEDTGMSFVEIAAEESLVADIVDRLTPVNEGGSK